MIPRAGRVRRSRLYNRFWIALLVLALAAAGGCASKKITLRSTPDSPLIDLLDLNSFGGPKPSGRTAQLLRVLNLGEKDLGGDLRPLLAELQTINNQSPSAEIVHAMSELAFIGGKKAERYDKRIALDLYGASVLYAYDYLFDRRYYPTRNPYDPQYRGACDLYNGALESALRIVCADKSLRPGATATINTASGAWDVTCVVAGGNKTWRNEDFERFEFVSDYEVTGLKNQYLKHGLGVPLIAIHRSGADESPAEKYYPPNLSVPMTAFFRPIGFVDPTTGKAGERNHCVLELYDTVAVDETVVAGRRVPLESDLTTPLAYFLSRPELESLATVGLLRPEKLLEYRPDRPRAIMGLYMAQPYEPNKIPVVMVHGLWSSPMTWMEMFNDLRSQPELRRRYQFWFYLYPTGQPFWLIAAQMRHDLARVREELDPQRRRPEMDRMVLVGHSMGGLVSRLQTLQGGDDFWRLASSKPLSELEADDQLRRQLAETFYFEPNPSIRRVISIATPYRGSTFSNQTTQWLLGKLIHLPKALLNSQQKLFRDNGDAIAGGSLLRIDTSVDSLSPATPIFPVMLAGRRLPWVKYHNIVGVMPDQPWWLLNFLGEGDGVVARTSAQLDDAESQIAVPADHGTIHSHPAAVLEVRRVLLKHLAELDGRATSIARLAP
ncbi:MAG: alpha/beta fold hydrolase [Pirellulales bacterium]|nr:alpha/beta fold hydrolase [Pirellulales bacterium]